MTIHQQELLEKILIHLPAKSIGRFRCVSKAWKSLLSQPQFIKSHLNRIKQHPIQEQSLILACDEFLHSVKLESAHQVFDKMMPTMLNNLDDHCFWEDDIGDKLTSCDGLIVVNDVHDKLMLINPTTREVKALPELPYVLDNNYYESIYGIGYDSHNDDYKVVTISFLGVDYQLRSSDDDDKEEYDDMLVNVYSVKNGTWKTVDESPFNHEACNHAGGVYLNGRIHWIARSYPTWLPVIVGFDLREEKFSQVPRPDSVEGFHGGLLIVEGCLCFWLSRMGDEHECFVMKEYGVKESWTKFTILDHGRLGIKPLCLLGEEQMVLLMDDNDKHVSYRKLVLYNVKEGTFEEIKIHRFPDYLAVKGTFVESLLSPHCVYRDDSANEV